MDKQLGDNTAPADNPAAAQPKYEATRNCGFIRYAPAVLNTYMYLILLSLTACSKSVSDNNHSDQLPFLIDSLESIIKIEREQKYIEGANYNPLYIGRQTERVHSYYSYNRQLAPFFIDYVPSYQRYMLWKDTSLDITVYIDTNRIIGNNGKLWLNKTEAGHQFFKAYPVYIFNKSKDSSIVGHGIQIPIVMEAKNKDGAWRIIEQRVSNWSLTQIVLPPDHIVITSAPVFKGDFKTQLRLRLGEYYSNVLSGTINQTQFESAYDNYGHRIR